ncbi:c-type cytochrome [Thiorhodovibrio frisius]|uniref:Cytochrome c556 n=1 Tax=Thiorhodovibrio frisius TaxID=631362 RepID=H8Z2Z7_9GAMM|nr:cytochrome c [Thiorhodovibrio frisius]EIC22769.1 cytochrome c556 [Thiorhodovibrio frisius]WPL22528.1 Cytochrome c' precursor [Thiorhodovibrio frisius]
MKHLSTLSATALLSLSLAGGAIAADLKPEEQIETRQAGYQFMSWNMGKIKASLSGDYNQETVQKAAEAIAGIANSGMGALYGPGTDKDVNGVKTRVKPELFTEQAEVGKVAGDFVAAANNMAEVAATGDEAEVKQAFGALGESCKACHKQFRKDD